MTLEEQETIINRTRSDAAVAIYTTNPAHMRRTRKDDRFTVTREHLEAGEAALRCTARGVGRAVRT